jgi:predicted ATPase
LRPSRCCLPDGSDLATLLSARRDIVAHASDWLERCEHIQEAVSIDRDPRGGWQVTLRRAGWESIPDHLAGEGLRWLLPIALCASWAELGKEDGPSLLAIEELESRLHPVFQLAAFDRLLGLVQRMHLPCVLETHSVYLLRRLQLAVIAGEIAPEDVAVYWAERVGDAAVVRRIGIDADGRLEGWQPETFEEEQVLSRQIFEARWKRRRTM